MAMMRTTTTAATIMTALLFRAQKLRCGMVGADSGSSIAISEESGSFVAIVVGGVSGSFTSVCVTLEGTGLRASVFSTGDYST